MEQHKTQIYPPELTLTCDDKNDLQVNFLDLHLEVKDKSIFYRPYDKRDHFNFPIVNSPNLSGK